MSSEAREGDAITCPFFGPSTITGFADVPDVKADSRTPARIGDWAACPLGNIDVIVEGAKDCLIEGRFAARVGLKLWHGGEIGAGSPDVLIGGPTITAKEIVDAAKIRSLQILACAEKRLARWDGSDRALFRRWFGDDSEAARERIRARIATGANVLTTGKFEFGPADSSSDYGKQSSVYAHVHSDDTAEHDIYLDPHFWRAPSEGTDNKSGALLHETSHFNDVGGTADVKNDACGGKCYGQPNATYLANNHPSDALNNADNYEYFMEDVQRSCP